MYFTTTTSTLRHLKSLFDWVIVTFSVAPVSHISTSEDEANDAETSEAQCLAVVDTARTTGVTRQFVERRDLIEKVGSNVCVLEAATVNEGQLDLKQKF